MSFYFDGFCPECLLEGRKVEMRLNEDDFWESIETGLQIAVFPPFATILAWRGKGKFRNSKTPASSLYDGLVLCQSKQEKGMEIFPDENALFNSDSELKRYLPEIYKTHKRFKSSKNFFNDPNFQIQESHLKTISKDDWCNLINSFYKHQEEFEISNNFENNHLSELYDSISKLELVFVFDWMRWEEGMKNLSSDDFNCSSASLLEISMFLTAIFRSDRFDEGVIDFCFYSGKMEKIFNRLKELIYTAQPN